MKAKIIGYICDTCGEMVDIEKIKDHPHEIGSAGAAVPNAVAETLTMHGRYGNQKVPVTFPAVPLMADMEYHEAMAEITIEAAKGHDTWGAFNSAHEGFAVLLEEVEELKAHVWMKQRSRDLPAMKKEAMQVAAMALRFMDEVCTEERGRR